LPLRKLRIKILKWVKEKQYQRSKRRLERGIYTLWKLDKFLHNAGISRQERRFFWREFGSNETSREEILRKLCERLGLKKFDTICKPEKGEE
jgi:hypothetical protein